MKLFDRIRKTFALQLVVFLFAFCLAVFVLIFVVNTYLTRKVMFNTAEQIARSQTQENVGKISSLLSEIETITNNIACLIGADILNKKNLSDCLDKLSGSRQEIVALSVNYTQDYLAENPRTKSITFIRENSELHEQGSSNPEKAYEEEAWFRIPVLKEKPHWSEPRIASRLINLPVVSYSVPVSRNNKIIAVVRTDISLQKFQELISSTQLHKSGYAILITGKGTFVTHPADSLVLNYTIFTYADKIRVPRLSEIGREMALGNSGFARIPASKHYAEHWICYAPVESNGWAVGVKFKDEEIMSELNEVNFLFSIILIIGLVLLLGVIYAKITSIFKPLRSLVKATASIGSGDFNVQLPPTGADNEVSLLTQSFAKMQSELKTYTENLVQTNREKDKITAEVKVAAKIQQTITPSHQHLLPNVRELDVYGVLEPAEDIGGDFYDAFMIDDRYVCFAIADVFGKGIVASMLMTMVQTMIRTRSRFSNSAVSLVREINTYLCKSNRQANFITALIGIIDLQTGVVEFCNAGHTPMYQRKPNQDCIRFGETHCTALGIFESMKIESAVLRLEANDFLIMFTDGVTEAMSKDEQFFGLGRIEAIISGLQNPTPQSIASDLIAGSRNFIGQTTQTDDLSVLVIKFNFPRS